MAKAVLQTGHCELCSVDELDGEKLLPDFYKFISQYRSAPKKLASFIVCLEKELSFEEFESKFWRFLSELVYHDRKLHKHDSRVSSDPSSPNFSFSIMEEAFFILAMHPDSPRMARRFSRPLIIFNPHQQFERLREAGIFTAIRDRIRYLDKKLQGHINPMLSNFGEESEIYQYTGKIYTNGDTPPSKEFYEHHRT